MPTVSLMGATYNDVSGVVLPNGSNGESFFPADFPVYISGGDTIDKSWAEIQDAYNNGYNIITVCDARPECGISGYYESGHYGVVGLYYFYDYVDGDYVEHKEYRFNENGLTLLSTSTFPNVSDTTATASDVATGKYFYTSNGTRTQGTGGTGSQKYTATIRSGSTGNVNNCYVRLNNGTKYYTAGNTFEFSEGDSLYCYGVPVYSPSQTSFCIKVNNVIVADKGSASSVSYSYVMPAKDIDITSTYSSDGIINIIESIIPSNYMTGKTVTPSTTSKTVATSNNYMTGDVTVNPIPSEYIIPSGTKSISANGTGIDVTSYAYVDVSVGGGGGGTYQTKTVTPTTSQQTVTPDSGYDALSSVTVNAMPSGTAGTPTASKGTVSNHSVSVTPSVTNTTGYITGSTKTGTAVTVSASELVSGTLSITDNGNNIDVTNYSAVNVALTFQTYYTGSSAPSSSLGVNGDIYLQS